MRPLAASACCCDVMVVKSYATCDFAKLNHSGMYRSDPTKHFTKQRGVAAMCVPAGSPSRGGDVTVHVSDINQPTLLTPINSVLLSVSVFTALSTVFHFINSPDSSPLSHSVLPVLPLPYWFFQSYVSL